MKNNHNIMKFEYKDLDNEGLDVLDVISKADKFNKWMFETISPNCKGSILEIGCGVGNISQYFIKNKSDIYLSDIRLNYRNIVLSKFNLTKERVIDIDIIHPDFDIVYKELFSKFDSIFCLNVIEHVEDDNQAVENMIKLLKPEGKITILVPAYNGLYNGIDKSLDHYRRYNKQSILKIMSSHGEIMKVFYFNVIGIFGWFVSGRLLKNTTIPEGEMKLYNFFVPVFKFVDKVMLNKLGLSVICVVKKQANKT